VSEISEPPVDIIGMEVIFNQIAGTCDEMLLTLRRASYSPNIKQRGDCSTAILNPAGDVIAQALVPPGHLGSMLGAVHEIMRRHPLETLQPGDMFIANDPYTGGGQHLPDMNVVAPFFWEGKCAAWVANCAHHADVGGMVPGSEAMVCSTIYQEGLRLPPVRLVKAGELLEDVINIVLLNSRTPDERRGDLMAQIAANNVGVRRLRDVYEKQGVARVKRSMDAYLDYTERRFRKVMSVIPDGQYSARDYLDSTGDGPAVPIVLTLTKSSRGLLFDFEGSAPEVATACNAPMNALLATIYALVKNLLDPELPGNAGYFRAIEVKAPEGTVINPRPGAAVGSRVFACAVVGDVIAQAFSKAIPEKALAGSGPHSHVSFSGRDSDGRVWVDYETIAGAYGARSYADGMDAVRIHMSGALNLPIEALEHVYPFVMEEYRLRDESGGHGKFRGGLGVVRTYRTLTDMTASLNGQRQQAGAMGMAGGEDGEPGEFVLNPGTTTERRLPSGEYVLETGNTLSIRTPSGGGFGQPSHRDRAKVIVDVLDGRVSAETANRVYVTHHKVTSKT
jgi:N-methylhydantoinase B